LWCRLAVRQHKPLLTRHTFMFIAKEEEEEAT
jgi:hypothetical protein